MPVKFTFGDSRTVTSASPLTTVFCTVLIGAYGAALMPHTSAISLYDAGSFTGKRKHIYPTPTNPVGHPNDPTPSTPPCFNRVPAKAPWVSKPAEKELHCTAACPFL